jgi:rod shape-determining protein MreD
MNDWASKIGWAVGLILLQVLILNNIHIGGFATPFLFVYFILKLSSDTPRNQLMIWAFCIGLVIDIFDNTPGMNAAALVLLAFIRPVFLFLFTPRDTYDNYIPSKKVMGNSPFMRYLIICVLIHHTVLLTIESFSFVSFSILCLRILLSTALTVLCIVAIEWFRK